MGTASKAAPDKAPSLEALLSFVAITHSQKGDETLQQLLLQCFVLFPSETYDSATSFSNPLSTAFGLYIGSDRIQACIDLLEKQGRLNRNASGSFTLKPETRSNIEARIRSANALQERVKQTWLSAVKQKSKSLDGEKAWGCLQEYLSRLFRVHGLQTVALLDATASKDEDQASTLKSSLADVINGKYDPSQRAILTSAITDFLKGVGNDPDRTAFVVQLADGAFSYYSLSAPPEVVAALQSHLKELTLFLDTNFLFGVLDLHDNPFGSVPNELLSAISKNQLPFKLRYHEGTELEMRRTIIGITSDLKCRHWPQALSRAAANSPNVSRIERRFHEQNSVRSIDPETFFKPYEHLDVLLKEKGIQIYRDSQDRLKERANLIADYQDFLHTRHHDKPYEAVDHDMTLLDCVRQLRSAAKSTLEAKALIITCDGYFNRFDKHSQKRKDKPACTVLPNQLIQLLRPFLPTSPHFDRSFAETFAIPEFRTLSSGSSAACSKLLALLATYKGISEDTVSALLANDLLIDRLKKVVNNEKQFKECVDAALLADNAVLLEETIALKTQLKNEQVSKAAREKEQSADRTRLISERDTLAKGKAAAEERLRETEEARERERRGVEELIAELRTKLDGVEQRAASAEGTVTQFKVAFWCCVAGLSSIAFVAAAEIAIHQFKWAWLLNHPNSYSIRVLAYLCFAALSFGYFRPNWRKWCWGSSGLMGLLFMILTLLGGPSTTSVPK